MTIRLYLAFGLLIAAALVLSATVPLYALPSLWRDDPQLAATILIELRLPRALLALVYGAVLGASGAAIQALFANPLASPDITGATAGPDRGRVYLTDASRALVL